MTLVCIDFAKIPFVTAARPAVKDIAKTTQLTDKKSVENAEMIKTVIEAAATIKTIVFKNRLSFFKFIFHSKEYVFLVAADNITKTLSGYLDKG